MAGWVARARRLGLCVCVCGVGATKQTAKCWASVFAVRQDPGHTAKALFAVCQDPRHTANSAFAVCPGPRHTSNNFLQIFLTELITFEKLFHNILSNEH